MKKLTTQQIQTANRILAELYEVANAYEREIETKKFFRYEAIQYASAGCDGEYETSKIPNPKLELREYNLWKETPKGYWIGYGKSEKLNSGGKWVSKTARKRFAYPTKKEALINFIKRSEKRVEILSYQVWSCQIALNIAINKKKHLP